MEDRNAVRAVILDVDGTLVDSNDAHAQAWVEVGKEFGYDIEFDYVRRLIGMGGDRVLPKLTGIEKASEEGREITERRGEIFRGRYLPELEPFAKVRELLERMKSDGFALVVASSANEEDLGRLLEVAGVADLIESRTSASDVEESKPDPDVVQSALEKAGVPDRLMKEQVVMIGDTPYDVEAARRAGIRLIGVRSGGWDDDGLVGAAAIYDDAADLLDHYDGSPLGRAGG